MLEALRDVRIQLGNELYSVCLTIYGLAGRAHLGAGMNSDRVELKRHLGKCDRRVAKIRAWSSEVGKPSLAIRRHTLKLVFSTTCKVNLPPSFNLRPRLGKDRQIPQGFLVPKQPR